ncbi:hypothetical protein HIJ39_15050, partial [Sulfobacillus sp. DSM 109850]|nr:hypothetical protein [Sulfobacillus harzensis]
MTTSRAALQMGALATGLAVVLGAFSKIDPDGSADGCQNSLGWAAI